MDEAPPTAPSVPGEDSPAPASSQLSLWPPEATVPSPESTTASDSASTPDPPWRMKDLGLFVLFAAFTILFAVLMVAVGFLLLREVFGWDTALERAMRAIPFNISTQVVWELLWLFFIYFTITAKYGRRFWQAIRWVRRKENEPAFFLGGIALAVFVQWFGHLFPSEKPLPIEEWFSSAESAYLLAVFGICIAPFMEELVFRGFFYPVFERVWGMTTAVALTAFLFALMHASQLGWGTREMAAIYVVGLVLSYCRGKTGSLVPSYLMHLAYNTTLFVALYFTTDRFQNFRG